MNVGKAYENFIRSRRQKGCLDKTLNSYKNLIAGFIKFAGAEREMEDISQELLEDYIDFLYVRKLSRSSVASYIRNMKIFLKWYESKNDVEYTADELIIPRTPKKELRLYTPEDIKLIFETIDSPVPWLTARNKAMVALMLDAGIRQGEVCSLQMVNIYFEKSSMKVCGKGNKERFVPLGNLSAEYLRKYLAVRPYDLPGVFVGRYGEPITCNAVKTMTWNLQKKLPFEFSSHKLRHNFAINYLLDQYERFGQMDIYQLMAIMGHEDISTTRRYLHEANGILAVRGCISHLDKVMLAMI